MEIERVVEKIGQYWSDRVSTFDKEHDTEDLDAWKATLEKLLGPDKRKSVLDLGTGTGFLCNMTGQLGYTSIGMDISSEMIKYAVRHSDTTKSNAVYLEGSALDLPFADNAGVLTDTVQ